MKIFATALLFLLGSQIALTAQTIETGKFRFYETGQMIGEETYQLRRTNNGGLILNAKTALPFVGQDKKPLINTALRMKADLSPQSFVSRGIAALELEENTSISVQGKTARVKNSGKSNANVDVADNFFTLNRYLPVAIEMMLVRYWLTHGRPSTIPLLPRGEAVVEYRGTDTITVRGKPTVLSRYHLSGHNWGGGWGRQTLWLDAANRLVAIVNLGSNIETNIYAFQDGYDSTISAFLKRAAEDGVDRLTQVANELSPNSDRSFVLVGATLIDVTKNHSITDAAVVINGDRIVAAGPRSEIKIPDGAKTIDVTGKFLLPGLWDMHSHLYQVEFGPTYLAAGITTARDVGNDLAFATTLRDAAKQKRGLGPRMLLAGYIDGKNPYHSFDVQAGTPAEARAAVKRYKNAGYEQIKIRDNVKPAILKVIAAEAHRLGMTLTGHVPKGMNALQAVRAGMDQISHLNFAMTAFFPGTNPSQPQVSIDLDSPTSKHALKFFAEHRPAIEPTMAVLELLIHPTSTPIETFEPGMKKVDPQLVEQINQKGGPPDEAEGLQMVISAMLKTIGALHKAGVPIVAGTDVGVPGFTLHRELELYVKAGLTPLEAIQTATLTPARVMKLENEVGTIEAGKRADIIILDANPLDNISNIRTIRLVITQGRLFESAKLREIVGFQP